MRRIRVVQNPYEARIDGLISLSGPLTIPFYPFQRRTTLRFVRYGVSFHTYK